MDVAVEVGPPLLGPEEIRQGIPLTLTRNRRLRESSLCTVRETALGLSSFCNPEEMDACVRSDRLGDEQGIRGQTKRESPVGHQNAITDQNQAVGRGTILPVTCGAPFD